jgi:hypothetical protein
MYGTSSLIGDNFIWQLGLNKTEGECVVSASHKDTLMVFVGGTHSLPIILTAIAIPAFVVREGKLLISRLTGQIPAWYPISPISYHETYAS